MTGPYSGGNDLDEDGADFLGFDGMAGRLATALVDPGLKRGMVVGLAGQWGSGKSSLVTLTKRRLDDGDAIQLDFAPWVVGDRDQLLAAFFADLRQVVEEHTPKSADAKKKVVEGLKRYSAHVGKLSAILQAAELAGLPPALRKALEKFMDIGTSDKPLSGVKAELAEALADLGTRIIVFIDDVDRLEPKEIVEVLRLVRSVADFPNVVYVLCYDPEVVANAITRDTGADGQAYLAKIVPITLPVPEPEPLSLQDMFTIKLKEIEPEPDHDSESRIYTQLRLNPRRLRTPRDVNRVLDAVRFLWPGLRGEVDFGDLVLLQLIRNANPALYRWIEAYCAYCAEQESDAGFATVGTEKRLFSELDAALALEEMSAEALPFDLKEIAPPFTLHSSGGTSRGELADRLSNPYPRMGTAPLIEGRRLASPDHYRLYFALSAPQGAPQATDFERLRQALWCGSSDAAGVLRSWFDEPTNYGTSKAAVALKRLNARDFEKMNSEEARNLLFALGEVMDERVPKAWTLGPGPDDWYRGRIVVHQLCYSGLPGLGLFDLPELYSNGTSMSWLADMLRVDIGKREGSRDHIFPENIRENVDRAFTDRMSEFDWRQLFEARQPLLILRTWRLLGFEHQAREMFAAGTKDDAGFLTILEDMVATVGTEKGPVTGIPPLALELVVDREAARERLFGIQNDTALEERARSVWERIQDGERA